MRNVYKFGDIPVEIANRGQFFYDSCIDYMSDEKPLFSILATDEDLAYEQEHSDDDVQFSKSYLEFIALYRIFCEKAVKYGVVLCHGSVIEVDGQAYLFTAPSGTGKSTHTRLWMEHFKDRAIMINDDKPLLRFEKDGVYAYGTPWDGKHHLSTNKKSKLKGICFLSQAKENSIREATGEEKASHIMKQIYRPRDMEAMISTMDYVDLLIKTVPMYVMGCNISEEAAIMAYNKMSE